MAKYLEMYRWGDARFTIIIPTQTGRFDLTGWTIEAQEVHPELDGFLTLEAHDTDPGVIVGTIQWDATMTEGIRGFRVQLNRGTEQVGFPEFKVMLK